jgi:membrane-bound lytic murein transglycosylase A
MLTRTRLLCVTALLLLSASPAPANALRIPGAEIEPATFADLDGWSRDEQADALHAFRQSCGAILLRQRAKAKVKALEQALRTPCTKLAALKKLLSDEEARAFFEEHFRPVRITRVGEDEGFLTGYYEPEIRGSRRPTDEFDVPFYRRPPELLMRAPGTTKVTAPKRGNADKRTLAGTRKAGRIVPFYDRTAIEEGALDGRGLEIVWTDDPIDAFFAHIQGSARVRLRDGTLLRINYHAQNGHPYYAVGRALIERGIVPADEMSMDKIRTFIAENEDEGRKLMRMNRSYIFFREMAELNADEEPKGAQGVSLTRDRSIAVDRNLHVYGTPFWIEAELPLKHANDASEFRRLMVAQDTGGAIVGPARADIYFGAGIEAGSIAGRLRHPGTFYMLVPRSADPARVAQVPLPLKRPDDLAKQ